MSLSEESWNLTDLDNFEEIDFERQNIAQSSAKLVVDCAICQCLDLDVNDTRILEASSTVIKSDIVRDNTQILEASTPVINSDIVVNVSLNTQSLEHPRHETINGARSAKEIWKEVGGPSKHMYNVLHALHISKIVQIEERQDGIIHKCCIGPISTITVLKPLEFAKHMFRSHQHDAIDLKIIPYRCTSKNPWKTVLSVFTKQGFQCEMPKSGECSASNYPTRFHWSQKIADKAIAQAKANSQKKSKARRQADTTAGPVPPGKRARPSAGGPGPSASPFGGAATDSDEAAPFLGGPQGEPFAIPSPPPTPPRAAFAAFLWPPADSPPTSPPPPPPPPRAGGDAADCHHPGAASLDGWQGGWGLGP